MRHLAAAALVTIVLVTGVHAEPSAQAPPDTGSAEAAPQDEAAEPAESQAEPAPQGQAKPRQDSLGTKWRKFHESVRGLATWNLFGGRLTLRAYAKLQFDATKARYDDVLAPTLGETQKTSVDNRRLAAYVKGTIDNHLKYVAGFEFGPDWGLSDLFVEGVDEGLKVFGYRIGDFRLGYMQEPFSLARITSAYDSGFLERSLPTWTFGPGNNLGYLVQNRAHKQRITWQVGFFSFGNVNDANASSSSLSVTARVAGRPLYRDGGRRLVHLGGAYSNRTPRGNMAQYRARPEARFVDFLVDTGDLEASRTQLAGLEAASVLGPLWLHAETIGTQVTTAEFGDVYFWGASLEAGYFLTGEVRPYSVWDASFGRVIPKGNYLKGLPLRRKNGGAFELVGRYSTVDLADRGVEGGKLNDLGLGFNWYVDASSKLMFNVIRADAGNRGEAGIVLLRFQYQPRVP